jgi:hypothetical protein
MLKPELALIPAPPRWIGAFGLKPRRRQRAWRVGRQQLCASADQRRLTREHRHVLRHAG